MKITEEELAALRSKTGAACSDTSQPVQRKPSKYHNKFVELAGKRFASLLEAKRYTQLLYQQKAGLITDLQCQVVYSLDIGSLHICNYIADFAYMRGGIRVVEDAKGYATPVYRLKKKLLYALHGIEVQEVGQDRP